MDKNIINARIREIFYRLRTIESLHGIEFKKKDGYVVGSSKSRPLSVDEDIVSTTDLVTPDTTN